MSYITYQGKYLLSGGKFATKTIPPELVMTFDSIANAPVASPTTVSQWNTWFDLPTNGTLFTSAEVVGNTVTLKGGSIKMKDYLFGDDACSQHIIEITDTGCVNELGESVFCDNTGYTGCRNMTKAHLPYVTTIGNYTFNDCEDLGDVDMSSLSAASFEAAIWTYAYCYVLADFSKCVPSGITHIPTYTFYGTSLASYTIPDSVVSIGDNPFGACYYLTTLSVSPSHTAFSVVDNVLFSKDGTTVYCYPGGKADVSYSIPNTVTTIAVDAFDSAAFASVAIPNTITVIPQYAFWVAYNLTSVTIPDSVTTIGTYAFDYCYAMTTATIGNGVTSIGNRAFTNTYGSLMTVNMYPTTAPTTAITAFDDNAAALHIKSGATGYNVAPWTNTAKFASITQDL